MKAVEEGNYFKIFQDKRILSLVANATVQSVAQELIKGEAETPKKTEADTRAKETANE